VPQHGCFDTGSETAHAFRQASVTSSLKAICLRLAPLVIYSALAWCHFGTTHAWANFYQGEGNDPLIYIWFIRWWPFAIGHHLNPLHSDYAWHPVGVNLAWTTCVPFLALVLWPVTLLAGPLVAYDLAALMAPATAAWTAFLLAFYLTRRWWPAVVAGYLFGFSSYELGQLLGHLNLSVTLLVPLAVWLCVARARGDLRGRTFIPLLAVVLVAQLGISSEILASLCVLGAISWCIFLYFTPVRARAPLYGLAADIARTAPLSLLLASPLLFYMYKGMQHGVPFHAPSTEYSTDLLNFLLPTHVTWLGHTAAAAWAAQFSGNDSEQGAYLGWPLILLLVLFFRAHHRQPMVRALFVVMCVMAVLSLGPRLHVEQHLQGIRMPWHLLMHLPLIGEALPIRFTLYVALCASLAAALWLAQAGTRRQLAGRFGLALLAALVLLPNPEAFTWKPWPAQAFFEDAHVRQVLGPDANVLILPFADAGPGMGWQVDAGMAFTQAAGYLGPVPPHEDGSTMDELRSGTLSAQFPQHLERFCVTHAVSHILIGPGTPLSLRVAIAGMAWPERSDRGMVIVDVPVNSAAADLLARRMASSP
jgi:hypothetical protein